MEGWGGGGRVSSVRAQHPNIPLTVTHVVGYMMCSVCMWWWCGGG